jgi:hypothetical protein
MFKKCTHSSGLTAVPQQSHGVLSVSTFFTGCRRQLEQSGSGCEVEVAVNMGCVLFREGDYQGAAAKFREAEALDASNPSTVRVSRTAVLT